MNKSENLDQNAPISDDWDLPEYSVPVLHDSGGAVDLTHNAWMKGKAERPASDAMEPNSDEDLVIGHYTSLHNQLREALKARYKKLHERFNKAAQPPTMAGLAGKVSEAKTNVTTDIAKNKHSLEAVRRSRHLAEQSRNGFKKANSLTREARYPESKLLHFAVILAIILLECVANMYYFAQGNELGLLGGIFQAALISMANVGSAIMIGYFVARAATNIQRSIRLPAIAGLIVYAVSILAFNLLAGHYRDLMSGPGGALERAMPSMAADPFGLTFHSVLLFVTGLIAAALGIHKGMTVDDTYLGYGDVDRDYRAATDEYTAVHERVQAQVLARMDYLREGPGMLRQEVADKRDTMEKCADELASLKDVYLDRAKGIESECRRQLKSYRQQNAEIRISPVPDYFAHNFGNFSDKDEHSLSLPAVSVWRKKIEVVEPLMKAVEAYAKKIDDEREGLVKQTIADFNEVVTDIDRLIAGSELATDPAQAGVTEPVRLLEMEEEA